MSVARWNVPTEHVVAFRAAYGSDGDWARLFARADGYLGTELLFDGVRHLTIDRWRTRADFEAFKARYSAEYEALDARCDALTGSETRLGAFDSV